MKTDSISNAALPVHLRNICRAYPKAALDGWAVLEENAVLNESVLFFFFNYCKLLSKNNPIRIMFLPN